MATSPTFHFNAGPGISEPSASRGAAFGDFDNDGDIDIVVNTVNDYPQLLRCDSKLSNNWIKVRTIGTKSNRSGIGARLICTTQVPGEAKPHRQIDEVRSGGGYFSQNDLRVHFGLGKAEKVDVLEIRWPSGQVDTLKDVKANQLIYVKEGEGITRTMQFTENPRKANTEGTEEHRVWCISLCSSVSSVLQGLAACGVTADPLPSVKVAI